MNNDALKSKYAEQLRMARRYISQLSDEGREEIRINGLKLSRKDHLSSLLINDTFVYEFTNSILIIEDITTKELVPILLSHGKEANIPDEMVGRHETGGHKGRGGFGSVKVGYNERLEPVAVKTVRPKDDKAERCLQYEVAALSNFDQLFSSTVCRPVMTSGFGFKKRILMKYAEGKNLAVLIRERNFSFEQKLLLALEIAKNLNKIHDNNYVFYDLKPENIMVDVRGDKLSVKLVDYGSVRNTLYKGTDFVQTERYRAPEDLTVVHPLRDLYSLGKIYFEIFGESFLTHDNDLRPLIGLSAINPYGRPLLKSVIGLLYNVIENQVPKEKLPEQYQEFYSQNKILLEKQKRLKYEKNKHNNLYKNLAFGFFITILLISQLVPFISTTIIVLSEKVTVLLYCISSLIGSLIGFVPLLLHDSYKTELYGEIQKNDSELSRLSELKNKPVVIAIDNDRQFEVDYFSSANIKLVRNDYVGAELDYTRFLESDDSIISKKSLALFKRGKTRFMQQKWQDSADDYARFLVMPGITLIGRISALLERIICRARLEQWIELEQDSTELLDIPNLLKIPGSPVDMTVMARILFDRAKARQQQNNLSGAEKDYSDILILPSFKLDIKDRINILMDRANLRIKLEKWQEVEQDLTEILESRDITIPNVVKLQILERRANAREQQYKWSDAFVDYNSYLEIPEVTEPQRAKVLDRLEENIRLQGSCPGTRRKTWSSLSSRT